MVLEDYKQLLSFTATVSTIIQFMTGLIVCRSIRQKGGSGDISGFPFVAGVLGCSLWLRYGAFLGDGAMMTVNSIGLLLQLGYTFTFYFYASDKAAFQKQIVFVFTVIILTLTYLAWEPVRSEAQFRLGLLCCATTLVFCSAPLASLGDVIKTRSTETLPYYLILANVVVSGQWFLYGLIIKDSFVQIPNFFGCLIAALQLCLFAVYPHTASRTKQTILV